MANEGGESGYFLAGFFLFWPPFLACKAENKFPTRQKLSEKVEKYSKREMSLVPAGGAKNWPHDTRKGSTDRQTDIYRGKNALHSLDVYVCYMRVCLCVYFADSHLWLKFQLLPRKLSRSFVIIGGTTTPTGTN